MDTLPLDLLLALETLARADQPAHVGRLAAQFGRSRTDVMAALGRLDGKGLVDAPRCRLTMSGLVAARALRGACARVAHTRAA